MSWTGVRPSSSAQDKRLKTCNATSCYRVTRSWGKKIGVVFVPRQSDGLADAVRISCLVLLLLFLLLLLLLLLGSIAYDA